MQESNGYGNSVIFACVLKHTFAIHEESACFPFAAASESDSQIINSNDFIAAHFAVFNKAVLSVNLSCAHIFGFI